jgi:mono/diheme cytochrome c family protein
MGQWGNGAVRQWRKNLIASLPHWLIASLLGVVVVRGAQQVTVKDGVYTKAQAERSKALWTKACAACHTLGDLSTSLKGPALTGDAFLAKWDGKTVFALANGIKSTMPNDFSMELDAAQATDVTALILQMNGFPAGDKELAPGDSQKEIAIIK